MATDEVLVETDGAVRTITLNRPDRLNAISGPMLGALSSALVAADRDPEVRVIVLTGAGRGFCAGLDLKEASSGQGIGGGGGAAGDGDPPPRGYPNELELRSAPPIVLHE